MADFNLTLTWGYAFNDLIMWQCATVSLCTLSLYLSYICFRSCFYLCLAPRGSSCGPQIHPQTSLEFLGPLCVGSFWPTNFVIQFLPSAQEGKRHDTLTNWQAKAQIYNEKAAYRVAISCKLNYICITCSIHFHDINSGMCLFLKTKSMSQN